MIIKNSKELEKNLELILDKILNDILDEIFTLSQENLINNKSVDTGYLLKSGIVLYDRKQIRYTAPYAEYVEYGTGPHRPPVEPIKKWVHRKLGLSGKEADHVAWAIVKAIEKRGTIPKPYLRPAIEKVKIKYNL